MPSELADVAHLPNLVQALRDRGYDHGALEKIGYRNWFRVLRDTWQG
jgi:membrane dipeptidase